MVSDPYAEACKQCTLKHLSTAVVCLTDEDLPDILKRVYFCGNLSHAANHFVKLDEAIAETMRALRIDAQDDRLEFILDMQDIKNRLVAIIEQVSSFIPPEPEQPKPLPMPTSEGAPKKRGCPCHAR